MGVLVLLYMQVYPFSALAFQRPRLSSAQCSLRRSCCLRLWSSCKMPGCHPTEQNVRIEKGRGCEKMSSYDFGFSPGCLGTGVITQCLQSSSVAWAFPYSPPIDHLKRLRIHQFPSFCGSQAFAERRIRAFRDAFFIINSNLYLLPCVESRFDRTNV